MDIDHIGPRDWATAQRRVVILSGLPERLSGDQDPRRDAGSRSWPDDVVPVAEAVSQGRSDQRAAAAPPRPQFRHAADGAEILLIVEGISAISTQRAGVPR